jgi:hypothetical protein
LYVKTLADAVFPDPKLQSRAYVIADLRRTGLAALACLTVSALLLAGCDGADSDPAAELRAWVAAAEREAEDRDRRALLGRIAESYGDARGNDRAELDKLFRYYLLRQKKVALLTDIEDIRVFGDSAAELALTVGMAGTRGGLDVSADAYRFELELEKLGGDWQLIGARWGKLGGELL